MPLPLDAFVVTGGCNCGAIRYRIDVPPVDQRPVNPTSPDGSVRFPFIMADHCNDCRRSLGTVLPLWLQTPRSMMSVRLATRDAPPVGLDQPCSASPSSPPSADDKDGNWLPGADILEPKADADGSSSAAESTAESSSSSSWLRFYRSSHDVSRAFCGRCGVHVSYAKNIVPDARWPTLFDVNLGTVDKAMLQHDWMAPERHLFWDWGIGWVKEWARGAIPVHADWRAV